MTGESPYIRENRSSRMQHWQHDSTRDERAEMTALAESYWNNHPDGETDSGTVKAQG